MPPDAVDLRGHSITAVSNLGRRAGACAIATIHSHVDDASNQIQILLFFVLNLSSRRYGAALTLTAALLTWIALGGGIFWAMREGFIADFEQEIAPYAVAASFAGAVAVAQLVNILLFDWLRGIPWWKAPFFAAFVGGLVFAVVFNTRPAMVWDAELGGRIAVEAAIHFTWALGQLLPTALLRRTIRPLPGFGGA